MGARFNFSVTATINVFHPGIRARFLEWFNRQLPMSTPYGGFPNPCELPEWEETTFDRRSEDIFRVDDLEIAVSKDDRIDSVYSDTLWIHVFPNVPMQEAWRIVPEFLKKLGITYADDVQEWYLRKVIGFCDEMIALQGSRR